MYAVIETGGKQYRVEVGTELEVELLDAEPGKTITLDRVLLVADGDESTIGQPLVDGAEVSAEVLRQDRGEKLISFKYRPKARSRVKKGHRQDLLVLRISDIVLGGKSAAKAAAKAQSDAKTERQRLEEVAAAQAAKDAELAAKLAAAAKPATKAKADSKPAPKAKAEKADAEAPADAKPASKTATKKPAAAKAATADATEADAGAAPKKAAKPRATKKDE
jgi:large subunit ribosomal protein L21